MHGYIAIIRKEKETLCPDNVMYFTPRWQTNLDNNNRDISCPYPCFPANPGYTKYNTNSPKAFISSPCRSRDLNPATRASPMLLTLISLGILFAATSFRLGDVGFWRVIWRFPTLWVSLHEKPSESRALGWLFTYFFFVGVDTAWNVYFWRG